MYTFISYKEGLSLTNKNRNFILVALISVITSKLASNSLIESKDFFISFFELLKESKSLSIFHLLRQIEFIKVVHLYILSSILFLISFATIIGLNGIIKELLINKISNIKKTYTYAKNFFWVCLKYKFIIYFIIGFIFLITSILYYSLYAKIGYSLFSTICLLILGISIFVVGRAFSSLGVKFIILSEDKNLSNAFHVIRNLFIDNRNDIFIFFIISTSIASLTFGFPIMLSFHLGVFLEYSIIVSFLLLSYFTAFLKLSSFIFFLNLYNNPKIN